MIVLRRTAIAVGLVAMLAACGGDSSENAPTLGTSTTGGPNPARQDLPPDVGLQLDSGNLAFRNHDYEAALRYYKKANELSPHVTATWFGISMAQRALGDTAAADSAMMMAQRLSPGTSLTHPTGPDTTM